MLRKAWIVPAVLSFTSALALAQQAPPSQPRNRVEDLSIRGKIIIAGRYDSDQRIEVRLEKTALQVIQTAFTDSAGNFEFRNLQAGSYYVGVSVDGYEPVHQAVEVYNNFGNTNVVSIFLNKPPVELRERLTGLDAADPDIVDVNQMKDSLPKKAVQDYEKAIEEKQKGRIDSAVKLLEDAVKIAPNFFHAHNNLGILYQSLKRYVDAEKEFKRSHQLSAKSDRPLVNLGSLYIEQSNLQLTEEGATGKLLDQALDALEEAIKVNPRSAVAYFLLGQANYKSSFLEEAETAFKKAHNLDPKMAPAQLMLANVYVKEAKWPEVIETLDSYLKEYPKAADHASVEEMRARIAKGLQASNSNK